MPQGFGDPDGTPNSWNGPQEVTVGQPWGACRILPGRGGIRASSFLGDREREGLEVGMEGGQAAGEGGFLIPVVNLPRILPKQH